MSRAGAARRSEGDRVVRPGRQRRVVPHRSWVGDRVGADVVAGVGVNVDHHFVGRRIVRPIDAVAVLHRTPTRIGEQHLAGVQFLVRQFEQELAGNRHPLLPAEIAIAARLKCNSSRARVMPTNNSRRSSSSCVGIVPAALVRQQPFFDGDDEHHREFQPLRGVQRHQRHAVVVDFPGVGVVDQAGFFQKLLQMACRPGCCSSNSRAAVSNSSMLASRSWSSSVVATQEHRLVAGLAQHVAA